MKIDRLEDRAGPAANLHGQRILIVEDEAPMRTVLKDILNAEGCRVLTAANGKSGLETALAEKPNLILLDVMLPQLDGFALCAELRKLTVATPVLKAGAQPSERSGLNVRLFFFSETRRLSASILSLARSDHRAAPCGRRNYGGGRSGSGAAHA